MSFISEEATDSSKEAVERYFGMTSTNNFNITNQGIGNDESNFSII